MRMISEGGAKQQPAEDDDIDIREAYPLMDEVAPKEGWDDPEMESYDVLRTLTKGGSR
jgi:hypothetical protein